MSETQARPTVLVLDDERNIRCAIEIALEQNGMHVIAAHDVAAAARILRERVVDLMVLDIRLGDLDGIAFFRKLQTEGAAVPTIFISGHATLTEAAEAVKMRRLRFSRETVQRGEDCRHRPALPRTFGAERAPAPDRSTRGRKGDRR